MKIVLKILNYFFVGLGVIFFLESIAIAYIYFADPFGVRPFLKSTGIQPGAVINMVTEGSPSKTIDSGIDKHPALSAEQEQTLESIGIDPATIPTEVSQEMEDCFTQKLGAKRVKEIEAGATPSASDLFKASSCL